MTSKKKSKGIAFLIWLFGVFGDHRYYVGDIHQLKEWGKDK